jgi:hypothetical protein
MPADAGFLCSKVAMTWESIEQTCFGREDVLDEGTEDLLKLSVQM